MSAADLKKLSKLNTEFVRSLPSRITVLETFWGLLEQEWDPETYEYFVSHVRRLEGASASFKLAMVNEASRPWLGFLREHYAPRPMNEEAKQYCRENLAYLRRLAEYWNVMTDEQLQTTVIADVPELPVDNRGLIYIVHNEMLEAARIAGLLQQDQYRTRCFENCLDFYMEFERVRPDLVILPMHLQYGTAIEFLDNFKRIPQSKVPVIGLLSRNDAQPSLKSMTDVGMVQFVREALVSSKLPGMVAEVLSGREHCSYRVMMMNDGEETSEFLQAVMELGGFQVRAVSNPKDLERGIRDEHPDLVLIDLDQPEQFSWFREEGAAPGDVPMLFLSAEPSRDWIQYEEVAGAYAFLEKDAEPWSLVSKAVSRIERTAALA